MLVILPSLKGQCHEIFDFWFFSWTSFPQALEYTIRAVSNFSENSRRYSQLKVHHQCRWHTSKTGGKICCQCRWYRWQICCGCRWYLRQFCRWCRWHQWQICHRWLWYRWCTLTWEYLSEFTKFETVLMGYSGAGGKLIHEKNQKENISWHCPFNCAKPTKTINI